MIDILTHPLFIWPVSVFVFISLLALVSAPYVGSYIAYVMTLKRWKKSRWSREIPNDLSPDGVVMYETGLSWAEENKEYKKDVHIVNRQGLNLYGEYYDFGNDKCAVILSGRTDSLLYGYYFAIPYKNNGYNVFVFDPRAHGLSEGKYNTVGFEESLDDVEWVDYLVKTYGLKSVVLHGICIGSAGGVYALVSGKLSPVVRGIVAEGMFANFGESVKNHMIEQGRKTEKTYPIINKCMIHFTGHSMEFGPIDVIDRLKAPLLMLHSKEDLYSTPEFAEKLFDKAGSETKSLVWFERGKHSMLRVTDTEKYDGAISDFLKLIEQQKEKENVL